MKTFDTINNEHKYSKQCQTLNECQICLFKCQQIQQP